MKNGDERANKEDFSLEMTDAADLTAKRSVRATFRLSSELIETVSALSAQLGIKQKSLFDHLMEDTDSLREIARRADPDELDKTGRVQKTFVISRKSLSSLDAVSKAFAASRDDLVEYSIKRLFPILAEERKKQVKREEAFSKIAAHVSQGAGLLEELENLLGGEDPVYKAVASAISSYGRACEQIENLVEKGKRISDLSVTDVNGR